MRFLLFFLSLFVSLETLASTKVPDFASNFAANLTDDSIATLLKKPAERGLSIVFVSPECPCSKSHFHYLMQLAQSYSSSAEFVFVFSNEEDLSTTTPDPVQEYLNDYLKEYLNGKAASRFPAVFYRDPGQKLADRLGALRTPHVFLLNKQREIIFNGGASDSHTFSKARTRPFESALKEFAQGQKISQPQSAVMGCLISRK